MSGPRSDSLEITVSSGFKARVREEQRRAISALLRWPLLQSVGTGSEIFPLVRRHADELRDWFSRHCGWVLQIESDLARLRKTPGDSGDDTRPLLDSKNSPFTRQRYVLLCLAMAVLEKSERQTVLCRLAEEIRSRFVMEPKLLELGFSFDVALRDHRRDLIEVIRFFIAMNVLKKVDGDEQNYVSSGKDVLYNINLSALSALPNFRRGPSTISALDTVARIATMIDEPHPDTEDGRNRRLRVGLFRKLLDDPIVYYADLDEQERAYLVSQRPSIVREIELATGLEQEARKEGVAMVDPADEMMDVGMPEEGTDGHVTLLIAEHLALRLRSGETAPVPASEIEKYVQSLIPLHRTHWRKNVSEPSATRMLVIDAITRLEKLRLITHDRIMDQITPRHALGRFAVGELQLKASSTADLWNQNS